MTDTDTVQEKNPGQPVERPRAIKYDYEIMEALRVKYPYEMSKLPTGYDYIEWNRKARVANEVFGEMYWSTACVGAPNLITIDSRAGFIANKRITVRFINSYTGEVETQSHEGTGFAALSNGDLGRAMDTASKAADSDALSKTFAFYGDALGLFLWDGTKTFGYAEASQAGTPVRQAPKREERVLDKATSAARTNATQFQPANISDRDRATDGQVQQAVKMFVPRATAVSITKAGYMSRNKVDRETGETKVDERNGGVLDALWAVKRDRGQSFGVGDAKDVLSHMGIRWVEDAVRGDGMLEDGEDYPEDYPE